MNFARVDGSAGSYTLGELEAGCDVQAHWSGEVISFSDSLWFSKP